MQFAAVKSLSPAPFLSRVQSPDPLDRDLPDDEIVVTTKRGLIRLALAAAETGARFEREDIAHDPVAWLIAPRRLFDGRNAVDACLGRDECIRTILLHGLSLGLDAEPDEIDDLAREPPSSEEVVAFDRRLHDEDGIGGSDACLSAADGRISA